VTNEGSGTVTGVSSVTGTVGPQPVRYDGLDAVPDGWPPSVVTVGVFDGVHAGHRSIVAHARVLAEPLDAPVVAVTFDPHPSEVVRPGTHPTLLSTLDHRVELLQQAGADAVVVLRFTPQLAALSPEDFVEQVLVARLHAFAVVVGSNFRFGHRAVGSVATLIELGERHGFAVEGFGLVGGEGTDHWSSTYVRQCVQEGDVAEAARGLGRPHRVEGTVVHGDHRGRELGYPTANLDVHVHTAVPADGVYAGWLVVAPHALAASPLASGLVAGERLAAAISIGTNPTFDGIDRRVEAYVLDRTDLDLYHQPVALEFVDRLRPTLRFDSVEELLAQMADDVDAVRALTSG
jgi:riboflavin kinase / FMN adenylyltransferase